MLFYEFALNTRKYFPVFMIVWTAMMLVAFLFNLYILRKNSETIAQTDSEAIFRIMVLMRQWNSGHGMVYVPVTEIMKPNPHLVHNRRDVVTNFGDSLTMVNTAFMTRQLSELVEKNNIATFHITSLNPIRPENKADEWETKALQTFKNSTDRFYEKITTKDTIIFRYMAPLMVEQGCLACHASQGYKLGDVRGGVSINNLYQRGYFSYIGTSFNRLVITYFVIFLVGFFLLVYFSLLSKWHKLNIEAKNKELQDFNVDKNKFFNLIAHDLRTPAANIESLLQIMKEKFGDLSEEEKRTCLDILVESTKTQNDLLNTLLNLSRLHLGSKQCNFERVDIRKLVNEALEQTKLQAMQKQINQSNQADECFAEADKDMITTVIRNIVANAIKFTHPDGKIVIRAEKVNKEIVISISDTGIGITDTQKNRIFDVDYSKSTTGTANETGTGLGLVLCKEYVECNGGKIWFESEVGKGTTFFFTLPVFTKY